MTGAAPGQYRGFTLQLVRLFYHLLDCDRDAAVGLEYADDVSVHLGSATVLAEQCKSARTQNPISNWAVDLWKTFANWIDNIESGVLDVSTTQFRLYVTPPRSGSVVNNLSAAQDPNAIRKLLDGIEKRRHKLSKQQKCDPHLEKVLVSERKLVTALIQNFELVSKDEDPFAPITNRLSNTIKPHLIEQACRYGIGEAMREIDDLIRRGDPALISAASFRKRFSAFVSANDSERYLHSLSDAPTDEVVQETLASAPVFVRQLDFVGADIETKSRAASDFLRTSRDRTVWADEGLVYKGSFEEYDDRLLRRHSNLRNEVEIVHGSIPPKRRGKLLYIKCCEAAPLDLEQRVVPQHFMPGSLNGMADRTLIGWHPNYSDMLREEDDG